ncbi:MAG: rod shape-determining protein MreC, partial [Candidatus Saccharimonadales bacterium]
MPVISQGDAIFGKIQKTDAHTSVVLLISAATSVVNVKIQQSDPAQPPIYGAVKGQGSFSVYLDLVSTQASLNPGDVLVTSALDGVFPADLPVGKVLSPYKNKLNPFQQASVQPFFDPQETDMLFVITHNHS